MWLALSNKLELEEALFHFLLTVRDGQPQAARPLVAEKTTLRDLYAGPHPDLLKALHHCLDAFLVELGPDPAGWGRVTMPAETLGVALAALNSLAPARPQPPADEGEQRDPVGDFTAALIATLPPARQRDAALAYHAVLRGAARSNDLSRLPPERARLLHALVERSPLTALWALDAHTPTALDGIAAELLPGWPPGDRPGGEAWRNADEWLDAVAALLAAPQVARWLRYRWLALPETRPACRNVGLLLEALRRRRDHRALILEFYEAYDYFCAETRPDPWRGQVRVWPVLETIEKLLRTPGDDEAAIRVNRWGNEYFIKFRPLIEIIIAEQGIPTDYTLLSPEFVLALRALLPYITEGARQRIAFGEIAFGGESEEARA